MISLGDGEVLVDLAIDSPPSNRPIVTVLGPTVSPEELAARKVLALFGRAEAREFADVYVLVQSLDREDLLRQAADLDPDKDTASRQHPAATNPAHAEAVESQPN